jgi:hypothetical protein
MKSRGRNMAHDEGASLILALIFITTVSLIVGGLLSYSSVGLNSAKVTETAGGSTTDVGSALQTATNDVRNSTYFNSPASPDTCLGANNRTTYTPTPGGPPITVTCAPDSTSGGAAGLVPVRDSNKPGQAVLTLATGSEVGLEKTGNRPLKIKGKVYSTTTIAATGSTACSNTWPPPSSSTNCNGVFVQGPDSDPSNVTVTAESSCTGTIVTPGSKRCPYSPPVGADERKDPADINATFAAAYAMPIADMTPQTLPTCTASPVTFSPGYYDDAVGLSQLMGGAGSCGGKTFWFQPGIYYFDFHNSQMPTSGSPVVPNGPDVWTFNDSAGVLVGGLRQGWTTSASNLNMPGSCVSPLTSVAANIGVQFVFGGDSQLNMSKGSMEICGTWAPFHPSLVLYGAKTDASTATQGPISLSPGSLVSTSNPSFGQLNATNLGSNSDSNAGPNVTGMAKNKTATLQVNAFTGLSSAIAPRAVLDQATVTVRHGELGANAGTTLTLTLTPKRAGATPIVKVLHVTTGTSSLAYQNEPFDITSDLRTELYAYGIANSGVPFTATVVVTTDATNGQNVSEQVDYLNLSLTWRSIVFRAQSGCVTLPGGCAVVQSDIHTDELYFQGTAYVPKARLDIRLVGVTGQVFRAGLIARSVSLNVSPSNGYEGPLIELPDNTLAPAALRVYLTAWGLPPPCLAAGTCPASATPSTANGWTLLGRTLVEYTDLNFVPVAGQRGVAVKSWRVAR